MGGVQCCKAILSQGWRDDDVIFVQDDSSIVEVFLEWMVYFKSIWLVLTMFWDAILDGRGEQGHIGVTGSDNANLVPVDCI